MEDSGAENDVNCGGMAQGFQRRKILIRGLEIVLGDILVNKVPFALVQRVCLRLK